MIKLSKSPHSNKYVQVSCDAIPEFMHYLDKTNLSVELGIDFDLKGGLFAKPAVENLNKLFKKINEINQGKKQYIILLDEVILNNDGMDFSELQLISSFINVLIAINPAGYYLTKPVQITSPSGSNVLARQLFTRHRNSIQIAVLLAHANKFYRDTNDAYKCLDVSNDKPLDTFNLPSGPLPIWIQRSLDATDEEVMLYLKESFLKETINITLVHSSFK